MRKVNTEEKLLKIHQAVFQLMERREVSDISMYDVAKECGMATSTVYHHYSNIERLFQHLLQDIFADFDKLLQQSVKKDQIHHWTDINRMIESTYVDYYNSHSVARKLILGRHTFSELLHADSLHDLQMGLQIEKLYRQFFDIPKLNQPINIFAISSQVADKLYTLSCIKYGYITPEMAKEAIYLTESYLLRYIPYICQPVEHEKLEVS